MKTRFRQIVSIRTFSGLLLMDFFKFLGGDVAWVFGRIFFQRFFGWNCSSVALPLKSLLRDFLTWRCFFHFLAENVSSEFFGRHLSWDFFWAEFLEKISGVRFFFRCFFVKIRLQNIFGGHVSQIFFGRSFFCNLLEEFSIQEFPLADCLVEIFSADVKIWVEFCLQIFQSFSLDIFRTYCF